MLTRSTEHFENVRGCAVMYVVDFMLAGYYQKCHDPDCRGEDRCYEIDMERRYVLQRYGEGNCPRACIVIVPLLDNNCFLLALV
jgi:hypothetical protein